MQCSEEEGYPSKRVSTFRIRCMSVFLRRFSLKGVKTMGEKMKSAKLMYPAADRNKDPIKETIGKYFQNTDGQKPYLLEISSGSGQHVGYLAEHYPWVTFQPTEVEKTLFNSINAHGSESFPNVKPVAYLDVREPCSKWMDGSIAENSIDYILNVNMIHISEWKCTEGLFSGCGKVLKPGQYLFTYGPYGFNGNIQPNSNVQFDKSLKSQHPEWGLKDVAHDLTPLAAKNGMQLVETHSLPANNHFLVWQKKK